MKVYKIFLSKPKENFYHLTKEEQDTFWTKMRETLAEVGGRRLLTCDCRWATEQWRAFGITEYPNIEAAQKHARAQEELGAFRYFDGVTYMGTARPKYENMRWETD